KIASRFGAHRNPPTDYFWSFFWANPDAFPTGSLGYEVHATMNNGERVTWEPFKRPATQLTVIAGEPTMAPAWPLSDGSFVKPSDLSEGSSMTFRSRRVAGFAWALLGLTLLSVHSCNVGVVV